MTAICSPPLTVDIDHKLQSGAGLPADFYYDPDFYQLEREHFIRRAWHFVGLAQDVAKPGDYITATVVDTPVIVVRDDEGTLRAHLNICRHRAFVVAAGSGSCKTFRCRYHSWSYDLQGRLNPASTSAKDRIEPDGLSLLPASVDTFEGMLFVSLDPTESLAAALGELPQIMAATGCNAPFTRSDDFELVSRFEVTQKVNWKLAWENSIECYHCPSVHPQSLSQFYHVRLNGERYVEGAYDRGSYSVSEFKGQMAERLKIDASEYTIKSYYLVPTTTLATGFQWGATVTQFVPTGPEEVTRIFNTYKRRGEDAAEIVELAAAFEKTIEEDKEVLASVQAGYRSGAMQYGFVIPEIEEPIRHFHRQVWDAVSPAYSKVHQDLAQTA